MPAVEGCFFTACPNALSGGDGRWAVKGSKAAYGDMRAELGKAPQREEGCPSPPHKAFGIAWRPPPSVLVPAGTVHIGGVRSAVPSRFRGVTSNQVVRVVLGNKLVDAHAEKVGNLHRFFEEPRADARELRVEG